MPFEIQRAVFENGIEIEATAEGFRYVTAQDAGPTTVADVQAKYGRRLVVAEQPPDPPFRRTLLCPTNGRLIAVRLTELIHGRFSRIDCMSPIMCLGHAVGAVAYHCELLAEQYAAAARVFTRPPLFSESEPLVTLGGQHSIYFEFEAVLASARTAYEMMRSVLWAAFGAGSKSRPRNFEKTLNACRAIPDALNARLARSWVQFGLPTKEYRDCVQHNVPIGGALPYARMRLLEGGVRAIEAPIPDNPEAKAHNQFRYTRQLDALTFAWELTNEVLEVAEVLVNTASPRS